MDILIETLLEGADEKRLAVFGASLYAVIELEMDADLLNMNVEQLMTRTFHVAREYAETHEL